MIPQWCHNSGLIARQKSTSTACQWEELAGQGRGETVVLYCDTTATYRKLFLRGPLGIRGVYPRGLIEAIGGPVKVTA